MLVPGHICNTGCYALGIHYLNATSIADVPTLLNSLVWGICGANCMGGKTYQSLCIININLTLNVF